MTLQDPAALLVILTIDSTASEPVVETAQQSTTNNPDEIVAGRTIAMNAIDFESMLKNRKPGGS